ncbi:MAG: hypothetical protein QOD53_1224 [Thermoleophilaceae bacterium]|jgi:hypothetical protein|nr:hypothetical protein [Thermoleophilaceae bacterium]
MTRRGALGSTVVVAACVMALAVPGASPAYGSACFPAGSHTIARSSGGRVYFTRHNNEVEACSFRYGRRVRLATSYEESREPYLVTDRWVVYPAASCEGAAGCYFSVIEKSLRSGRKRFDVDNGPYAPDCGGNADDCGVAGIGSSAVKRDGSAAWIACDGSDGGCWTDVPRYVIRVDARGTRTLDHGHIRPRSLTLSRDARRISWDHAGARRSAPLR